MSESGQEPTVTDEHFHAHLRRRMEQRGITENEVREVFRGGWPASNAKPGTHGRTLVFAYEAQWEGAYYEEKEVTVYFKKEDEDLVLLTAIARYGNDFPRAPKKT